MEYALIQTIVIGIVSAFIFGMVAKRLKLPTVLGYLLAGVFVGPFTPGIVADIELAKQLAEIGVMLLMFGVGLHFSLRDLLDVRAIALPGALFQMTCAVIIGAIVMLLAGFGLGESILFGFALSVASTVVLLRALEQRRAVTSKAGKIAVGWLIVEDLAMVLAIVLLPAIGHIVAQRNEPDFIAIAQELITVILKIGVFAFLMIYGGRAFLPWVFMRVKRTKSKELTSLCMLSFALGFAYVAHAAFDASYALGAFLAGLVLNESKIGHKSVEQLLPLRDTFSVLFFVSVGMLFDPMILVNHPFLVLMTLAIITIGKSAAALFIVRLFKQDKNTSGLIAISLAQIGEFSFIFAGMAVAQNLMSDTLHHLILAGALLSIATNHFLFKFWDKFKKA